MGRRGTLPGGAARHTPTADRAADNSLNLQPIPFLHFGASLKMGLYFAVCAKVTSWIKNPKDTSKLYLLDLSEALEL